MGSPQFAVPSLQALLETFPIVGVVTQPDRPAGRGQTLKQSPIKLLVNQAGIPVIQPVKLRQPEAMTILREWQPDLIVVAAFGQILRQEVLDLPPHGCINVHASLLPRWRGAAPIQSAILNDDQETGITIMRMDAGIDTGAIISQVSLPIKPDDTAGSLSDKLAILGAQALMATLPRYLSGEVTPTQQDERAASFAPMLKKEDGRLDFTRTGRQLVNQIRAMNPWPGTYFTKSGNILKVLRASFLSTQAVAGGAGTGTAVTNGGKPAFVVADGLLVLEEVQPAGKRVMSGKEFLAGARDWAGNSL
jgi:methionyl-tRNA formyltransferase